MKISAFLIVAGLLFSAGAIAKPEAAGWRVGEEGGWREIFTTNNEGYTINFTCDMGAKEGTKDHAAGRVLYVSGGREGKKIDASTKWSMESMPNVITLKMGDNSYNIENQATAPARREWYRFWNDTVKSASKTVDVYVDGRNVTSFNLSGIADIYKTAPQDGCLKKDTN
ncbi:hypothetical protein D7A78_13320 [Salmonella enterica]|nr:hypothetical protein [Salmonella enterica]